MSYSNISPEKFKELTSNEDHIILDVRAPQELVEGQVEGHMMINFFEPNFKAEVEKLDKSKAYLIYCRSGNRSGQACTLMSNMGFERLYNLEGGIKAWNETISK